MGANLCWFGAAQNQSQCAVISYKVTVFIALRELSKWIVRLSVNLSKVHCLVKATHN